MCFSLKKEVFSAKPLSPPIICSTLFLTRKIMFYLCEICSHDACRNPSIVQKENSLYCISYLMIDQFFLMATYIVIQYVHGYCSTRHYPGVKRLKLTPKKVSLYMYRYPLINVVSICTISHQCGVQNPIKCLVYTFSSTFTCWPQPDSTRSHLTSSVYIYILQIEAKKLK